MSHPLLTRVIAGPTWSRHAPNALAETIVAAIPPDIADRLEAALDVCQWPHCHGRERERRHTCTHKSDHWSAYRCHPFVPLVTP
jgi:hypothetical protein